MTGMPGLKCIVVETMKYFPPLRHMETSGTSAHSVGSLTSPAATEAHTHSAAAIEETTDLLCIFMVHILPCLRLLRYHPTG